MKRETGENPVRTRHRISRAEEVSTGRPGRIGCVRVISRETCLSQYRNEKVQATRNWQYEMDHRTVCGIIQFYFRCLRFLTEAFFGYIFGRS